MMPSKQSKLCPTCGTQCTVVSDDIGCGLAQMHYEPVEWTSVDDAQPDDCRNVDVIRKVHYWQGGWYDSELNPIVNVEFWREIPEVSDENNL